MQVKLLPELLSEGDGCVGADGVSPLSQTALLIGEALRWLILSAIRVVPQSDYDLCLFNQRKEIKVFFIKMR